MSLRLPQHNTKPTTPIDIVQPSIFAKAWLEAHGNCGIAVNKIFTQDCFGSPVLIRHSPHIGWRTVSISKVSVMVAVVALGPGSNVANTALSETSRLRMENGWPSL